MMVGARPVFADIDPDRLTLDPDAAAAAVTPRTAAIMPVHLYGQPADMTAIAAVASRHNLAIVEDCCQAHLATCDGRPVGSFGAAAAYSFYPTKNLGALGDGGAVTTSDARIAAHVKRLRNGGQTDRYRHGEFGVNSRLDEMQAAILRARLPLLPGWTERRRALARTYRTALAGTPGLAVPPERDPGHVYHLFPVRSAIEDRPPGAAAGGGHRDARSTTRFRSRGSRRSPRRIRRAAPSRIASAARSSPCRCTRLSHPTRSAGPPARSRRSRDHPSAARAAPPLRGVRDHHGDPVRRVRSGAAHVGQLRGRAGVSRRCSRTTRSSATA